MCALPEDALLKANNELNEVPEERAAKTESLRGKIGDLQRRDKLPQNCRTDDRMLVRFLRGNKFDVDKSLSQYTNYQNFRSVQTDIQLVFYISVCLQAKNTRIISGGLDV